MGGKSKLGRILPFPIYPASYTLILQSNDVVSKRIWDEAILGCPGATLQVDPPGPPGRTTRRNA